MKKETAISKAIAIKEAIEIVIGDQVCDRDQASVGYATRSATKRATAIGYVYQVCATQVQGCYRLERATCGERCPRHGDRDRVAGFDWLTLNIDQFASKYTCRLLLRVDDWPPDVKEKSHTLIK